MDAIFQTTYSNVFSWMNMNGFRLIFHWSLFPSVQLTITALVQIMAWRRPCDKPLYEAMVVSILTHIFVTPLIYHLTWSLHGLQHINSLRPSDAMCVSKLTIIASDNGLSPGRHQAIIWTNAGILLIRTLGRNFSEILGKIHSFSGKKMHLNMSSAKGCLFSLCLNELIAKTGIMCTSTKTHAHHSRVWWISLLASSYWASNMTFMSPVEVDIPAAYECHVRDVVPSKSVRNAVT